MSVEQYEKYAAALETLDWDCKFVEYGWHSLPASVR